MKRAEIGKIEYGSNDRLTDDDLKPENTKVRITTMVSGDVLDWLKSKSATEGVGYQTILNMILVKRMRAEQNPREKIVDLLSEEDLREIARLVTTRLPGRQLPEPHTIAKTAKASTAKRARR